jgi:enoyl-CoA hydratase/carnithine racemase
MSPVRGFGPFTDDWEHFRLERAGQVATLTFTRPERLNALTFEVYADLRDLLVELPERGDTRALVLRGEGRAFCSGGDVDAIIGALLAMRLDELLAWHCCIKRSRPSAPSTGGYERLSRRSLMNVLGGSIGPLGGSPLHFAAGQPRLPV